MVAGAVALTIVIGAVVTLAAPASADVTTTITSGGAPVTVTIATAGENAALTFTGAAGQRVFVGFSNNTIANNQCCNTIAYIKKPDGSALTSMVRFIEGNTNYIDTATLPTAGTYTIYVDPTASQTGSITVTLYDVAPDPAPSVTPTAAGASVSMTTTGPGQNVAPTFTGSAGQRIFVGFSNNTIANNQCCNTTAWIKAPDGSALTSMVRFIEGSTNFVDTATLSANGTYTVVVDPQAFNVGSITVTLYSAPADPAPALTPTESGASASMTTANVGQNFGPTFTASAGQRVFVAFSNNTIANGQCCNTTAWIKAPDGSALTSIARFIDGSSTNYIDTTALPTSGTYTVVVDPQAFNFGSITASVYLVPPDANETLELTSLGSPYTFTTASPGHGALLTFDGTTSEPVSVKLTANTITGGGVCALAARILNPDGSTLSNNICVTSSGATLGSVTLPADGLYSIVVDPTGAGVGSVVITLYLEAPEVTPGGELYEDVVYTSGGSYSVSATADLPSGIKRTWLEQTGTGEIATSATCNAGPGACPQQVETTSSVDTSQLAEGEHVFVAKALGSNGKQSDDEVWRIFVDRTAPSSPSGFRVETYDTGGGIATLAWDEGGDPDLPGDVDGAGPESYDYRYRVDAQAWSDWLSTADPSAPVAAAPGSGVALEVKESDGAGNVSPLASTTLFVSGAEAAPDTAEVQEPAFIGQVGPLDAQIPDDTQALSFVPTEPCGPGFVDNANAQTWSFTNCDGTWDIYRDCFDDFEQGGRFTVGPGYIAHMKPPGLNSRPLVRDDRIRTTLDDLSTGPTSFGPLGGMNGGLGTFGFHYARSTNPPGQVPSSRDVTRDPLPQSEADVTSVPDGVRNARKVPVIEGRQCAGKNGNANYGVYAVTHPPKLNSSGAPNNPRFDSQGNVRFAVSVWFRDEWGNTGFGPNADGDTNQTGDALARVTYTYIFQSNVVRAWMVVTTFSSTSDGAFRYIKEPKFVAVLRGGGFSRLKVFGGAKGGLALPNKKNNRSEVRDGSVFGSTEPLRPRQIGYNDRTRVQWDYGSDACSNNNCFNAVMRAYPVVATTTGGARIGRAAPLWEQTEDLNKHLGSGLDWWARESGAKRLSRGKAYPRDTEIETLWPCTEAKTKPSPIDTAIASEHASTNIVIRRRWEIGGWKATATSVPFVLSGAIFSGWNGGRGPWDCEPLQVKFPDGFESFGTFASYSIGPGWTLK